MAKVITVTNNKGGVAKTTTAINLGAALRRQRFDVLLIDFDGQHNLTDALGVVPQDGTTYDTMKKPITSYVPPVRVLTTEAGTCGVLDVLPSCRDLSALEFELSNQPDRVTRFRSVVDKYRDKYDFIIIDTPPAVGVLTVSALTAADETIITVKPEYMAIQGLLTLTDTINTIEQNLNRRKPRYVLFTQYDSRKGLHRATVEQVTGAGFPVFNTRIRDNVALGEAPAAHLDIFRYNRKCNGAQDYAALADEYTKGRKFVHLNHRYK